MDAMLLVYALLAVVFYYAGLRLLNKGNKSVVNLDSGRLQLYALVIMFAGLAVVDVVLHGYIVELLAMLPAIGMAKRNKAIDILDGRGDIAKKADRILAAAVAAILAVAVLSYLPQVDLMQTVMDFVPYILETAIIVVGLWLTGNKDDNLTKVGMGLMAVGATILMLHLGIMPA